MPALATRLGSALPVLATRSPLRRALAGKSLQERQGFSLGLDQLLCRLQLLLGKHRPLPVAVALKGQPVGRSWSRRPLDEGTARPIVTLLAPPGDQRGVQTLAPTDGADCSRLTAGLCLVDLSQAEAVNLSMPVEVRGLLQ